MLTVNAVEARFSVILSTAKSPLIHARLYRAFEYFMEGRYKDTEIMINNSSETVQGLVPDVIREFLQNTPDHPISENDPEYDEHGIPVLFQPDE